MPKGSKRTAKDYEDEIERTTQRMRKKRESLRPARESDTWIEYLDNLGIDMSKPARVDFFEKVRQEIIPYESGYIRKESYSELRQAGFSAKEARRMRDWSPEKQKIAIENPHLF